MTASKKPKKKVRRNYEKEAREREAIRLALEDLFRPPDSLNLL